MRRILWLTAGLLQAQVDIAGINTWRQTHEREILREYIPLLEIPNRAPDLANIRRNAGYVLAMLTRRGVASQLLEIDGVPPVVYGEIPTPGAKRTLIFYAHYDGQPVDPKEWTSPPWKAVLRNPQGQEVSADTAQLDPEMRVYARSASDDKAPIMALMASLDAMKSLGIAHKANIKFFFEGEEEAGSLHLEQFVQKYKHLLAGDVWLICDGPVHQNRAPSLYFGVRGVTTLDVTVYGPKRELHSGHYGNWAPNPAMMLSRLLATMTDGEGKVLVAGFYDDTTPMTAAERKALLAVPGVDEALKEELGLVNTDGNNARLVERLMLPSLNIRGLESAGTGANARNVVPAKAVASLDLRLVKGNDHRRQAEKVKAHIRQQGYYVIAQDPTDEERRKYSKIAKVTSREGYNAVRTSMDLPIAREVIQTLKRTYPDLVLVPGLGGSVPLWVFEKELRTPLIGVPIVNHDNNQHSANENLRLANLWQGIVTLTTLLAMP
ncbi:MAG: M20/M25/M40 family metallo-hydrolase [Bryobacteraceae bacterium]|nr:M20/M25/M40 family metallo-hydrolase [Bryobacteraceae bacterium]